MKKLTSITHVKKIINLALQEDIGSSDITTRIFVPDHMISKAFILTREKATLSGLDIAAHIFRKLDKNVKVRTFFKDGAVVQAKTKIMQITGKTRALLTGERTALNFLSHLSGIATTTNLFVKEIMPYKIQILDTRKTTPGLRILEKWAVRCAKGVNHRMNLHEMVLIKDNHHVVTRPYLPLSKMIKLAKQKTKKLVCIEIENLKDFKEVYFSKPDIILLDNMDIKKIQQAVNFACKTNISPKPLLEVSGGVSLKNIRAIAKTGINRVSIGALTHARKAINLSMELS